MRLFDLLKMNKDIENSLNEYIHKLEKYKTLKKGQLASVADDDLKTAVMSRMQEKFNEKRIDENEVIILANTLPVCICRQMLLIINGGLTQLFFNTTKGLYQRHKRFRLSGEDLSRIMKEAKNLRKRGTACKNDKCRKHHTRKADEFDNEFVMAIDFDSLGMLHSKE